MTTDNLTAERHEQIVEEVLDLSGSPTEILFQVVNLLHEQLPHWNWVGIYFLAGEHLILGPYAGQPTEHTRIPVGMGVCGTAVKQSRNLIVDDVHQSDNYLACSEETRSEIVVLIEHQGRVVGQFDVDSDRVSNFTKEDERLLEELAEIVSSYCNVLASKLT